MSRISILRRSIRTIAAALVFVRLLSQANASYQHDIAGVEAKTAVARSRSMVLTSRLPWLAPVGHRQPQRADIPRLEAVSAWERQQLQLDQELDRKLIICRGC